MKKLRSERGASILMALVLLLLASMVSAVILTAATGAARRVRNDREAQQDYLTVSSAAEMIRDGIRQDKYYRKVTVITYQQEKREENGVTVSVTPPPTVEMEQELPSKVMCEWLSAGIDGDDRESPVSITGSSDTIEISVPTIKSKDGEKTDLKTVIASFTMESGSGDITVTLRIEPENESESAKADSEEDCRMTLTLKESCEEKTSVSTGGTSNSGGIDEVRITETTITWDFGKIVKGIKEASSEEAEK